MSKNEKKAYFDEEWIIKDCYPEFVSWLVKRKENTQAKCKLCHKVIKLSNMGIQALRSHQKGKKHISVVSNMSCFFKSAKDPPVSVEESISKVNGSSSSKQQILELNVLSSEKISAEIMWPLHCCFNGISNNLNQDTSNLFQTMFPDSKIVESFQMGPNKIGYNITHGLGPYFKVLRIEQLNQSPWLVVSFDESINKKTQTCQMYLLIRYWNEEKMQVEVRY